MPKKQPAETFVSHLECSWTGERYPADRLHGLSAAGKPLLVRYDLASMKSRLSKSLLTGRAEDMWRYAEFLPVRSPDDVISLGEGRTPLIRLTETGRSLGAGELWVKDEGRLPTGSFKARGLALAVTMARVFGVRRAALPSAGNAGAALAAYAARAGIEAFVFCPDDAPEATLSEAALYGARVFRVNGNITEIGPLVEAGKEHGRWFNMATLREPYRIEGKKTMGLELAEQLGWDVPDVIFYPTGGGTGLIGMWKAFDELEAIGWIGPKRPRMVAVQSTGCAPIVRAHDAGLRVAEPWPEATTSVPGVRVPSTIGDFLILDVLRESGGFGVAVPDEAVEACRKDTASRDGVHLGLEGAATVVAWRMALADGRVQPQERVVLFNCGSGLKYPMTPPRRSIDRHGPIDWAALTEGT